MSLRAEQVFINGRLFVLDQKNLKVLYKGTNSEEAVVSISYDQMIKVKVLTKTNQTRGIKDSVEEIAIYRWDAPSPRQGMSVKVYHGYFNQTSREFILKQVKQ